MDKETIDMQKFVEGLPKVELHLHIEGTLEPELMFKLAKRNDVKIPFKTPEEVRKAYKFNNLQSFLDIYYQGANVLIHEQDFHDLTMAYLERCHQDNVVHTEIFFDPQTHTERGISFDTVVNGISSALEKGKKDLGISSHLIMCFLRHLTEEEAFETLESALKHKEKIIGTGLDSSEKGHPPEKFKNVFKKARDEGFLAVAHAGEEGPALNIKNAIELLGVKRVDHGVRCVEDAELVEELIKTRMPLTVCPLSNLKLKVINDMKEHNLIDLLRKGLCVTINSDDPAYFGGYMNDNFNAIVNAFEVSSTELAQLTLNGIEASFISDTEKQKLEKLVKEYVSGF